MGGQGSIWRGSPVFEGWDIIQMPHGGWCLVNHDKKMITREYACKSVAAKRQKVWLMPEGRREAERKAARLYKLLYSHDW